jgi:hypothetical protein
LAARREAPTSLRASGPSIEPSAIGLDIGDRITHQDVAGLCERVRELLVSSDADIVVCNVGALHDPDIAEVGALARLQLATQRLGREIRFFGACSELQDLLTLMGLGDVLPLCGGLPVQTRGKAKEREQTRGIEEERDPADPTS